MEKAWIYEVLFFQVVMIENKNRCTMKDEMSMKICLMHYRNYIK